MQIFQQCLFIEIHLRYFVCLNKLRKQTFYLFYAHIIILFIDRCLTHHVHESMCDFSVNNNPASSCHSVIPHCLQALERLCEACGDLVYRCLVSTLQWNCLCDTCRTNIHYEKIVIIDSLSSKHGCVLKWLPKLYAVFLNGDKALS